MNVIVLDNDVAEVDADPEIKSEFRLHESVPLRLLLLDFDGATHGVDHAVEVDKNSVAHGLDQTAVMFDELRFEDFSQVALKTRSRAFLVDLAQMAVANDVGDQDGG